MLKQFGYSVWLIDNTLPSDHQDREWVACFVINAENKEAGQYWGDHLARSYCSRNTHNNFLNSSIEPIKEWKRFDLQSMPVVDHGEEASDEFIGW